MGLLDKLSKKDQDIARQAIADAEEKAKEPLLSTLDEIGKLLTERGIPAVFDGKLLSLIHI